MEKSKNIGYVSINTASLNQVCEDCRKHIKDVRAKKEADFIVKFMTWHNDRAIKRNSSFIGRWFPINILNSIEEAKEYMDKKWGEVYKKTGYYFMCDQYYYHSSYGSKTMEHIDHLLACCNSSHVEDIIEVDVETYACLLYR